MRVVWVDVSAGSSRSLFDRITTAMKGGEDGGADQPVVLVLDDAQHLSESDMAIAPAELRPALVIAIARTQDRARLIASIASQGQGGVQLLQGVSRESAQAILLDVLGTEPLPMDAQRALLRMSDGNPFCLIEFARAVCDEPDLRGGSPAELPLPASVRELAEARVASLDGDDRELLSVAACCGASFDPVVVCEAAGIARLEGLRSFHRLARDDGFVVSDGMRYCFRDALAREALHDDLPPALRATYHTALGAVHETTLLAGEPPSPEDAYALARHFLAGHEPQRAQPYVVVALQFLNHSGEGHQAIRMATQSLELLPDVPSEMRARVLMALGTGQDGRSQPRAVVLTLQAALAAAQHADDRALVVDIMDRLGAAISHEGKHAESASVAAKAVEIAATLDDPVRHANAMSAHSQCLYMAGRIDEAFEVGRAALAQARASGSADIAMRAAMHLASLYLEAADLNSVAPYAELSLAAGRLHGDLLIERFASSVLGKMKHLQAQTAEAQRLLDRAHAISRELGSLRHTAVAEASRSYALFNRGHSADAAKRLEHASVVSERLAMHESLILLAVPRTLALSSMGELGAALALAEKAVDLLTTVPLPGIVTRVCPVAIAQLAWMGDFEAAEALAFRADAAGVDAGTPRELVQLAQARAGMLDAKGETQAACDAYIDVRQRFEAFGTHLHVALVSERIGGLRFRLDDVSGARNDLERAIDIASNGALPAVTATCGIWLDLLPGGNAQRARIALERDEALVPARARLRLWVELARQSGKPEFARHARDLASTFVASAPHARQQQLATRVSLMREALA